MNVLFVTVKLKYHNLTTQDIKIVNDILKSKESRYYILSDEFTGLPADLFSIVRKLNSNGYRTELNSESKKTPMNLIIFK